MSDDAHPPRAPPPDTRPDTTHDDADELRAELQRLRRDLAQVQREFGSPHEAQLREANEQLVLSVLQAEAIAETATAKLIELTRITQRDALTDTPNRALMLDRLETALSMAKRRGTRSAVLFVDIDHFKQINDRYGHLVGDEVLKRVARQLETAVRDTDTVSRHSGDEFLVLLAEISKAADAAQIAAKMLSAIAALHIDGLDAFTVSASVGVAIYPDDGRLALRLIDRADAAMYRAKKMGGGVFQFHGVHEADELESPPDFADTRSMDSRPAPFEAEHRQSRQSSDLREANQQLVLASLASQELEARATQAHLQQVTFLAMVVHELRNPLAPIRNAAELLDRARGDEQQHRWLQETIKRQVTHMARIVDDLLDGSRADMGKFHLEFSTVDLADILTLSAQSCRPAMDDKHQRLRVQLHPPLTVHGDPVRLAQVFRNLLDNAAKYTRERGRITLSAMVIEHVIVVTVADNGIGIAAEALPRVFELFVQDERAVAVHRGGLGIGLAVVRELVEAHGGTVAATSAGHDQGSEFVVRLPLGAVAAATALPG